MRRGHDDEFWDANDKVWRVRREEVNLLGNANHHPKKTEEKKHGANSDANEKEHNAKNSALRLNKVEIGNDRN